MTEDKLLHSKLTEHAYCSKSFRNHFEKNMSRNISEQYFPKIFSKNIFQKYFQKISSKIFSKNIFQKHFENMFGKHVKISTHITKIPLAKKCSHVSEK